MESSSESTPRHAIHQMNQSVISDRLQSPTTPRKRNEYRRQEYDINDHKHIAHQSVTIANIPNLPRMSSASTLSHESKPKQLSQSAQHNQLNQTNQLHNQKDSIHHSKTTVHVGKLTIKELSNQPIIPLNEEVEEPQFIGDSSFILIRKQRKDGKKRSKSNCTETNPYLSQN